MLQPLSVRLCTPAQNALGRENFVACGGAKQRHRMHQLFFKNVVDMWNKKHQSYFELSTNARFAIRVKYEELVANPELVLKRVHDEFGIKLNGDFRNIDSSTKTKNKDFDSYQAFYVKELWKLKFDHLPTFNYINRGIDKMVLKMWNYQIWTPSEQELEAAKKKTRDEGKAGSWMLLPKNPGNAQSGQQLSSQTRKPVQRPKSQR